MTERHDPRGMFGMPHGSRHQGQRYCDIMGRKGKKIRAKLVPSKLFSESELALVMVGTLW